MDYLLFERNVAFKFEKAAHMNIQVIGLGDGAKSQGGIDLEQRVRKLLKTFES